MIDYEPRACWRLLYQLRGSVLPVLLPRILGVAVIGAAAAWLFDARAIKIPPIAHTLIGVALGLLLVFRTNTSYDRYWEGRRLLGTIVNRSRDLARQVAVFVTGESEDAVAERARLVRHIALTYRLIGQHLRGERDLASLGEFVTPDERALLEPIACRPLSLTTWMTRTLAGAVAAGRLTEHRLQLMDANLTALCDCWGGCERIVKTPIPFAYAQHIKAFLFLFCATAPFAMVDAMRWFTPLAAAVLAFALFGIDEIGVEIEDPFGHDANDLPIDRIGDTIARDTAAVLRA